MNPARRAVIDVGTNSIKLLVADVAEHQVTPVFERSKQTRLGGQGFYETHRLQANAIELTAQAVGKFAETAREQNADAIRIIATSAARDAINSNELTSAIEAASGLKVEIITGEQEAEWVFKGVTTDRQFQTPLLILDVGGGSAEFILGSGGHSHFRESFPIGTVRLLEKVSVSDPPKETEFNSGCDWVRVFLRTEVQPKVGPAMTREGVALQLVGTGGTTSILGRMEAQLEEYDRARIEATKLSLERLQWHTGRLWGLPLEERKQIVGLPDNRADVILMGVVIYQMIMENFGFKELRVSTRGLRFAAVLNS